MLKLISHIITILFKTTQDLKQVRLLAFLKWIETNKVKKECYLYINETRQYINTDTHTDSIHCPSLYVCKLRVCVYGLVSLRKEERKCFI